MFNAPGIRGGKHADDLRTVVDAMLYVAQTGCQWRYLPATGSSWSWWTVESPQPPPAHAAETTTTSATGWLQVAGIATTLRHRSRKGARSGPVALAA